MYLTRAMTKERDKILAFILAWLLFLCAANVESSNFTKTHQTGFCAFYDYCAENEKGFVPCPDNRRAVRVNDSLATKIAQYCPYLWSEIESERVSCCTEETVTNTHNSMKQAFQFISGCPACMNNFAYLWCTISCSPNQSLFTDVITTTVDSTTNLTAVKEVNIYFTEQFKSRIFDSCKEVKFGLANLPFIQFLGNPQTKDDFFAFLGTPEEGGGEAPYSLKFLHEDNVPSSMHALSEELPTCGSPGFECSCADCSSADYCVMTGFDKEKEDGDSCRGPLQCYEYGILVAGILTFFLVTWIIWFSVLEQSMLDLSLPDDGSDNSYEVLADDDEYHAVFLEGEAIQYPYIEKNLRKVFQRLGVLIAEHPAFVIITSLCIIGIISIGNVNHQLESSPQGLWTPRDSRSSKEQESYQQYFGPYYRVENLIIQTNPKSSSTGLSSNSLPRIVSKENIELMFKIQEIVNNIETHVEEEDISRQVRLKDVCYKPLGVCVIESVLQYWQMDKDVWDALFAPDDPDPDFWAILMADDCFQHWTTRCRSNFESPIDPKIVLGGFPLDETFQSHVNDTTAFIVTYLLDSDKENEKAALAWEEAFIKTAETRIKDEVEAAGLDMSFRAERSTADEIDRETYMDALTVFISYFVMFAYIALSLTFLTKRHGTRSISLFVQSHTVLAFQGIGIVILSVIGALGIISSLNFKVSLIVLEVIPFLILALGVDNMFIIANEVRSLDTALPISIRMGTALSEVGPSITCAALAEALAFGLAAIAPIPAVRTFSICACFAVLLDFFLQCTLFVALLVADTFRRESGWIDCAPCFQINLAIPVEEPQYIVTEIGTPSQQSDVDPPENILQQAINKYYVPFIFNPSQKIVRWVILSVTVIMFFVSLALMTHMERGMEEQVAFPSDSYLQDYFTKGLPQMRVGAPVLFVLNDLNISSEANQIHKICGTAGCASDSLVSQIDIAASMRAYHLASPTTSWIDDFTMWLNMPTCCRTRGNSTELCPYDDFDSRCIPCSLYQSDGVNDYQQFLPGFMKSAPGELCPRGGKGAYEDYIQHERHNSSAIVGLDNEMIQASSFRTYYSPLVSQQNYIEALEDTNKFADDLSNSIGLDIYAYSIFHVFFQQYLNIVEVAIMTTALAVLAVFTVCWILLGSFVAALLVMSCILMILVDLVGIAYVSDVKLNGVSVVNFTMSVGIAVEFCVHLTHAFLVLPGSRLGRISSAFRGVGLSVFSGIAITKFVGVIVLGFATTEIFKIYYFRIYMGLVLLGVWHGLVVLPVLLALFGPRSLVVKTRQILNNQPEQNKGPSQ